MIKSTFVAKLFATLLFLTIYLFIFFITTKDKESRINLLLEQQITTLKHSCNALKDRYDTISKIIINNEILGNTQNLELFYNAKFANNEEKTRYRDALYEQIKPHFHHFQEIGIETVLFAFWDNKAFL
ncbi:MAG: Histidine kinase, partial [Campylobacterota bacterium]|nr:Histidine kinase [Campylobacterota bacterium]